MSDQRNPHRDEELLRLEDEREELEREIVEAVVSWAQDGSPENSFQNQGIALLGENLATVRNMIAERGGH